MRNPIRTAFVSTALVGLAVAALTAQAPAVAPSPRPSRAPAPVAAERPEIDQQPERTFRFARPIIQLGQDATVGADDVVREVRSVFGDVTIEGRVEGEVMVVLGSVRLASTAIVEGSVVVIGGSATIETGASIQRDLVVVGGTLTEGPGFAPQGDHVVVGSVGIGNALRGIVPWLTRGLILGRLIVPDLRWMWVAIGIIFLIYLVLNAVFDRPVRACSDTVIAKPLSAFLLGLLVLILAIPAIVILAATVVGILVIPFALCAFIAAAVVGKIGVARAIGRRFVEETSSESRLQSSRSLLIGGIILTLAYMVPVLGLVTWGLTSVLGVGAAAVTFRMALRRENPPRPRPAAPVVEPRPATMAEPAVVEYVAAAVPPEPPAAAAASLSGRDLALYPRAAFLDRVAAFALDCLLVAITVQWLDLSRHDGWFPILLVAYHIAFWAWKGTTLGGIVCGLRVVRMDGTDPRPVDALVRGLAGVFSVAALGIGCFWMLQDPERQMWHDKIAGTLVVKVPKHLVLP